jgi:hypothetical protein
VGAGFSAIHCTRLLWLLIIHQHPIFLDKQKWLSFKNMTKIGYQLFVTMNSTTPDISIASFKIGLFANPLWTARAPHQTVLQKSC